MKLVKSLTIVASLAMVGCGSSTKKEDAEIQKNETEEVVNKDENVVPKKQKPANTQPVKPQETDDIKQDTDIEVDQPATQMTASEYIQQTYSNEAPELQQILLTHLEEIQGEGQDFDEFKPQLDALRDEIYQENLDQLMAVYNYLKDYFNYLQPKLIEVSRIMLDILNPSQDENLDTQDEAMDSIRYEDQDFCEATDNTYCDVPGTGGQ